MPSRAERGECSALHDGGPGRERSGGGISYRSHTTSPSSRGKPSVLLCADKPAVVATDAFIPRRPPNLGGEFKELDDSYIISIF